VSVEECASMYGADVFPMTCSSVTDVWTGEAVGVTYEAELPAHGAALYYRV
jgi:hypothetical protein